MTQPSTPRSEELRLALVLNGGVSLAVWMGGVAFELNRLVRETHPVYRGLLELTDTAARIDVISGTSAGGINGAALALAQIHDKSLYLLRDVWLDTGGLEQLLHRPDDADLRSLLRGDDWFLPKIRQAFKELAQGEPAKPAVLPLSLTLTSTLLDGLREVHMDDFGAAIEDTVHRAAWRFRHLETADHFADRRIVEQLAFAARSTASFPVAFEPALFEADSAAFADAPRLTVHTAGKGSPARRSYLLDGGILDNKPFDAALADIARLPAEANTRRVLAYVVPDPAAAAETRPEGPDGKPVPPTLAQAAWRSLVTIPASQSIASHMAELRGHNQRAARRWRRIVGAVTEMGRDALVVAALAAMPAYRARRIDGIVEYFLEETERSLAEQRASTRRAPPAGDAGDAGAQAGNGAPGMRRATRQWLASTWRSTARGAFHDDAGDERARRARAVLGERAEQLRSHWRAMVPSRYAPDQPLFGEVAWPWGLYAVQFMAEFTIEVLRRTQRLQALLERWSQHDKAPVPPVADPPPLEGDDIAADRHSAAQRLLRSEGTRLGSLHKPLKDAWSRAYATASTVRRQRERSNVEIGALGSAGFARFVSVWTARGGEVPPDDDALAMLQNLLVASRQHEGQLGDEAHRLCDVLVGLREWMERVVLAHGGRVGRADIDEAVSELRALHDYLFLPLVVPDLPDLPPSDAATLADRVAWRVLALEVFEVSAGSRRNETTAQAEVVQISARLATAFGGSDDPARRVNGMQLAHFGAFYKRSWRANDWTFGCLDGIDRAVRIALNPDALQRRFGNRTIAVPDQPAAAGYVYDYLRRLAVDSADGAIRSTLDGYWKADHDAIVAELAWLDQPSTVPPPVLEHCARALTRRLQLETLRRELPEIAASLLIEKATGAPPSREAGEPLLARVAPTGDPRHPPDPEAAIDLVKKDLLGQENLAGELGTDQMTRTASQGLATAHAALSSRHGGLSALSVLFKATEWPLRVLYWLASRLARGSATAAAAEALALGVGAALIVAGGVSDGKLPGAVLAFGWGLFAGAVGAALLRSVVVGLGLVVVLAAVLLLLGHAGSLAVLCIAAVLLLVIHCLPAGGGLVAALAMLAWLAWWSAGASADALLLAGERITGGIGPLPAPRDAKQAAADLDRLQLTLWPALGVAAALLATSVLGGVLGVAQKIRASMDRTAPPR